MSLQESTNDRWCFFQEELFPFLSEEAGPLGDRHEQLIIAIEHSRLEHQIRLTGRRPVRPRKGEEVKKPLTRLQRHRISKISELRK